MKKLQQKLSKVYLRQQAKGGIIDLEEEGKKMLVVTGGEESSSEFTELSPTDYQLGKKKLSFSFNHNLFQDCVGIPCAPGPASLLTSPKKQQEQGGQGAGHVAPEGSEAHSESDHEHVRIRVHGNDSQCRQFCNILRAM